MLRLPFDRAASLILQETRLSHTTARRSILFIIIYDRLLYLWSEEDISYVIFLQLFCMIALYNIYASAVARGIMWAGHPDVRLAFG